MVEEERGERHGEEAVSMAMSELLARADLEEIEAKRGDPPQMQVQNETTLTTKQANTVHLNARDWGGACCVSFLGP